MAAREGCSDVQHACRFGYLQGQIGAAVCRLCSARPWVDAACRSCDRGCRYKFDGKLCWLCFMVINVCRCGGHQRPPWGPHSFRDLHCAQLRILKARRQRAARHTHERSGLQPQSAPHTAGGVTSFSVLCFLLCSALPWPLR